MQATELVKYIHNPALLDKQSVDQLQKLVKDFPYFQSAHMLLSIASKKWDASVYQQSLKKTAIIATNRAHLFQLIHQSEETSLVEEKPIVVEKVVVEEKIRADASVKKEDTYQEDTHQELDILKAAEIASEPVNEPVTEKEKPVLSAEQILEKEIESQVVASFVEKEIIKTPELHRPKATTEEPENFTDWLSFLKKNNGQSYTEIEVQVNKGKHKTELPVSEPEKATESLKDPLLARKQKNKAIIDKIIESSPGLIRQKEDQKFYTPDIKAKESLLENEHLVTETLARIYALQGSVNKAVRAYEILSLKFPQKSAYFATLIQKLKNNQ